MVKAFEKRLFSALLKVQIKKGQASALCTGPIEGVSTGHRFLIGRAGEVPLR
jgi:hypothetical protein